MTSNRDQLFIDRMSTLISDRENELYKAKEIKIRHNARKILNKTVFEKVFFLMRTGISWSDIQFLQGVAGNIHYQSIYKRFQKWNQYDILQHAWKKLFEKYKNSRLSKDATHFTNLYIDTTMIKNLAGRDCTGGNPTDRGRLATKVSIIIDKNKIPVSEPVFYPANKNDISTIEGTIDKMPFDLRIDGRRTLKLAGDKAYRSKVLAQKIVLTKKIRIVSQPKKNEKHAAKIGQRDKSMFKNRIYIEHFFGMLKRMKRLRLRSDRNVCNYKAFWFIHISRMTFNALVGNISNNILFD